MQSEFVTAYVSRFLSACVFAHFYDNKLIWKLTPVFVILQFVKVYEGKEFYAQKPYLKSLK